MRNTRKVGDGMLGSMRDVAIIILALVSLIVLGLTVALFLSVLTFLRQVRKDLQPILRSGQATVEAARRTFAAFGVMAEPMQQIISALIPLTRLGRFTSQVGFVWQLITPFLRRKKR